MDSTISALVEASNLPLSVLIVGVGQADFSNMNALDADNTKLHSNGRVARRDIVQFVALKDHMRAGQALTMDDVSNVSRSLLAEIPGQVLEYFSQTGITPNPRPVPVAPPAMMMAQAVPPPPVSHEDITAHV
jgi:hypothetical protein